MWYLGDYEDAKPGNRLCRHRRLYTANFNPKPIYLAMTRAEIPSEEVGSINLKGIAEPITLYRIPHATEVGGYKMISNKIQNQHAADRASAPVDMADLPYGGLALARLGYNVSSGFGSQQAVSVLRSFATMMIDQSGQTSKRTWQAFVNRYQQSRFFRLFFFSVVLGLLAISFYLLWPEPEPISGWQRFVRDLGIKD